MLYTYFYLHKKPLYTSIKGMPKHLGKNKQQQTKKTTSKFMTKQ